jgi:hypothetical protein
MRRGLTCDKQDILFQELGFSLDNSGAQGKIIPLTTERCFGFEWMKRYLPQGLEASFSRT